MANDARIKPPAPVAERATAAASEIIGKLGLGRRGIARDPGESVEAYEARLSERCAELRTAARDDVSVN